MKEIWVRLKKWDKELLLTAIEFGATGIWTPPEYVDDVRKISRVKTISNAETADILIDKDLVVCEVKGSEDQERILFASRDKFVLVKTTDWHIIPLENLVAGSENIFVEVQDPDSMRLALNVLERGVRGVVVDAYEKGQLKTILAAIGQGGLNVELTPFEIREVRPVGLGHRVCVDTCSILKGGQGLLVGSSSSGLFLVHGETLPGPYAEPRPFRVNAGAVHSYVMCPGMRTKYLMELGSGQEVMVVDQRGEADTAVVGRCKIEKRPLIKVSATFNGSEHSVILQNAETIRLVSPDGSIRSVTQILPGEMVMGLWLEGGRHFGRQVDEWILEV